MPNDNAVELYKLLAFLGGELISFEDSNGNNIMSDEDIKSANDMARGYEKALRGQEAKDP